MTDPTPAPLTPQPVYPDDDVPPSGPPVMDADAPARAGEWLGRRVMHEPSRAVGEIVGRAASGWWWVEAALTPAERPFPRLMASDALIAVTPEFEAAERARVARIARVLEPYGTRRTYKPPVAPPPQKRCTVCGRVRPIDEFYQNRTRHDGHSAMCYECERARAAVIRERRRAREHASLREVS